VEVTDDVRHVKRDTAGPDDTGLVVTVDGDASPGGDRCAGNFEMVVKYSRLTLYDVYWVTHGIVSEADSSGGATDVVDVFEFL